MDEDIPKPLEDSKMPVAGVPSLFNSLLFDVTESGPSSCQGKAKAKTIPTRVIRVPQSSCSWDL